MRTRGIYKLSDEITGGLFYFNFTSLYFLIFPPEALLPMYIKAM